MKTQPWDVTCLELLTVKVIYDPESKSVVKLYFNRFCVVERPKCHYNTKETICARTAVENQWAGIGKFGGLNLHFVNGQSVVDRNIEFLGLNDWFMVLDQRNLKVLTHQELSSSSSTAIFAFNDSANGISR